MKQRYLFGVLAIAVFGLLAVSVWLITRESPAVRELRAKCDAIEVGMTRRQVAEHLGRPAGANFSDEKLWDYPEGGIWVSFNPQGTVKQKHFQLRGDVHADVLRMFGVSTAMPPRPPEMAVYDAVQDLMHDIGSGHTDVAYASTTAEFQKRYTLNAFRAFVARYPALDYSKTRSHGYRSGGPGPLVPGQPVKVSLTVDGDKSPLGLTLTLKKIGILWEVDDMTVQ